MIPAAPFTVVNVLAGALRIRFTDFLIGSLIGLLPGTLTTIVVGDRLLTAFRYADWKNVALAIALAAAGAMTFLLLRRLTRYRSRKCLFRAYVLLKPGFG
jgi:uncharacterized membrane protein YdjX (TVP38/TMEM64 family)